MHNHVLCFYYSQPVIPGRFGVGCIGTCYCAGNIPCDPVDGTCPAGCEQGYEGQTCSVVTTQGE